MDNNNNKKIRIHVPGSKSLTHRAFIISSLAQGTSTIKRPLLCEDTIYTLNALQSLGVKVSKEDGAVNIKGIGGRFPLSAGVQRVFLGNSGTSVRLLCSIFCLARRKFIINGSARMNQRPVGELVSALRKLGAKIEYMDRNNYLPLYIKESSLSGGRVQVEARQSSQYVSSLMIAAPYASNDTEILTNGQMVSRPYVDMTASIMKRFGASVSQTEDDRIIVKSGSIYQGREYEIEPDASSASYFWAGAAITGSTVVTEGIDPLDSDQGDVKFLDVLQAMGCNVDVRNGSVLVTGGRLTGIEVDMGNMPDMVPTLATVAVFAKGKTRIMNVAHLRLKESDRLSSIATEWKKLGAQVHELPDGLVIEGGTRLQPSRVDPHNDHRIAMSLAVISLMLPGMEIVNKACVNKSFPEFWGLWEKMMSR